MSLTLILGKDCKIEDCQNIVFAKGWCGSHYKRWYRWGSPFGGGTPLGAPRDFMEAAAGTDTEQCIPWPFATNGWGYGRIMVNKKPLLVTRLVLAKITGESYDNPLEAAHLCGRPACINPKHLDWKNPVENAQDKKIHGTHVQGERVGSAKLTREQVLKIREDPRVHRLIAEDYGVGQVAITNIKNRRTWRWV